MGQLKCEFCQRSYNCRLKDLAISTLPWVKDALESGGSDWKRSHEVGRALRGNGGSPGFTEDWKFDGAMTQRDVKNLIETIIRKDLADLALLCRACRHYSGPDLNEAGQPTKDPRDDYFPI